jgi:hypothetical protein
MVAVTSCVRHTEVCWAHWPRQPALCAPKHADCVHRDDSLVTHRSASLALIVATRSWCTEAHRSRSPWRPASTAPKRNGRVHPSYSRAAHRSAQPALTLTTRYWHAEASQARPPWRPASITPKRDRHVHRGDPSAVLRRARQPDTVATRKPGHTASAGAICAIEPPKKIDREPTRRWMARRHETAQG